MANNRPMFFIHQTTLSNDEIGRVERYLDAVRSNLLFAKGILLVEGDAGQILLPALFKTVIGLSLDEIGVSLVNIGSTGFQNVARLFHKDRINKHCAIITDSDKSIVALPDDPDDDTEYQKHYRASEHKGKERKALLDDFCDANSFLKTFYAEHTFEVDLLMNDNSFEFVHCLDKIYRKPANVEKSKDKLEDKDVKVAGVEVLRLADKYGKGWLALLVAEQLVYNTYIPNYILEAIAFASSHLNSASKAKAISYRLTSIRDHKDADDYDKAQKFVEKEKPTEQLIRDFCTEFADDQLTKFFELL